MRTQVGIVGAGPAGLLLSHLLAHDGIESVVLESRSREYVEKRVRAGVLEHGTVDLLHAAGVGDRLEREGLVHHGIHIRFDGADHRIPLTELTGKSISVYGQQEVVKDLIAARLAAGGTILFGTPASGIEGSAIRYAGGELECQWIAGCDGTHGICHDAIAGNLRTFDREYPFAWLGILARTPPANDELIYAYSERGFALHSMRTPEISRLYLQVGPDDSIDAWPDERIWSELRLRLNADIAPGEILDRSITTMRSHVVEPMQHGRVFLAGDAAHVVPPTGAKGLNLAVADVAVLAKALTAWHRYASTDLLDAYSETCLRRVWRAEHFSWWMTAMLHRFPDDDPFQERLQLSQLRYLVSSRAAMTSLAENYVGYDNA